MSELPFFRWFVVDAIGDETYRSMSDRELGFYHRCLEIAWLNDGIPADPVKRARALGRTLKSANSRWTELVSSRFRPHPRREGYLVDPRQEIERLHAHGQTVQRSRAVRQRWGQSPPAPQPKPALSSPPPKPDSLWQEFRHLASEAGMPGSEPDWQDALTEWRKLAPEDREALVATLRQRAGEPDLSLASLPRNYIRGRKWERQPINGAPRKMHAREQSTRDAFHNFMQAKGEL